MKIKFMMNEYILVWKLLFGAAITNEEYKLKKKLWTNFKKEYKEIENEKDILLKDPNNFIPRDDTIYNIVMESETYGRLKKSCEKYRLDILQIYDHYKKEITNFFKKTIRTEIKPYYVYIVNKELNVMELCQETKEYGIMILGKEKSDVNLLLGLLYGVVGQAFGNYDENDIKEAILELCIYNELGTILNQTNCYNISRNHEKLKEKIYPYFLMYLGIPQKELKRRAEEDHKQIEEDLKYNKTLSRMSLDSFIKYCIKNKSLILNGEIKTL